MTLEPGICLVHKEVGRTSFDVLRAFHQERDERRSSKRLPICHGGTLDPFASGLLLVLVGPATRLFELLHAAPKRYIAEVAWGLETDTGDAGGKPVHRGDAGALTPEQLAGALEGELGWRDQVPPATSAKKIRGEPAYRRVHRGEVVELPPSRVYLHRASWTEHELPKRSRLEIECRGGYYVRALARDLGRRLGCGAHLTALRRTHVGPYVEPTPGERIGVRGGALLPWLPSRALTDQEVGALRKGEPLTSGREEPPAWPFPAGFPPPEPLVRALHQGRLIAILERSARALSTRLSLGRGA